jgi:DNA-binding CsgD family transcriptional regulator
MSAGTPGAVAHLREALDCDIDQRTRTAARLQLAIALGVAGRRQETIEVLGDSLELIAAERDTEVEMQFEGILACSAQLDPATAGTVRARLARYEGRLRGDSLGERLLLAAMAFDAAHRPLPATFAADMAELALGDDRLLLERFFVGANFPLATWTLVYADRLERAEELLRLAIDRAREMGSLVLFAVASACHCHVRMRQGRVAEAEAEARSTLEAAAHAWIPGRSMLIACLIDAMLERHDLVVCAAFLAEQGIDEDLGMLTMGSRLLHSRGHLRLAGGDAAGALRDFEQIRAREELAGMTTATLPTRASAALARGQLGEGDRAVALAHDELGRARIWGTPTVLSFALRAAGIVTGGQAGLALLGEAADAVEHSPARLERARSLTEYGAALRRAGHRRDARPPLAEALELADRCGAQRTAARAREELLATGARPRRTALRGADSLTPSERRVGRLAADGLGNRDIAQALFVTVRTVEGHLTQAYMKLDIAGREGLANALGPGGPAAG